MSDRAENLHICVFGHLKTIWPVGFFQKTFLPNLYITSVKLYTNKEYCSYTFEGGITNTRKPLWCMKTNVFYPMLLLISSQSSVKNEKTPILVVCIWNSYTLNIQIKIEKLRFFVKNTAIFLQKTWKFFGITSTWL